MFGLGKKKSNIQFNVVRDKDTVYIEFSEGAVDTSADEYMTSVISLPIALDMVDAVSLALLRQFQAEDEGWLCRVVPGPGWWVFS